MLAGFQNTEQSIIKLSSKNSKYILSLAVEVPEPPFATRCFEVLSYSSRCFSLCSPFCLSPSSISAAVVLEHLVIISLICSLPRCVLLRRDASFWGSFPQILLRSVLAMKNSPTTMSRAAKEVERCKGQIYTGAITVLHHESLFGV